MKYNIILFDADETLFDFKRAEREAFGRAMIEFGIDYDESYHLAIYKEINDAIWKECENNLITSSALKVERFRRLSARLKAGFDAEKFANAYMKHLATLSFLLDDSEKLIKTLYKTHTLIIVTNGLTYVQNGRIKNSSIAKYFKDIIISEEAGVSKPNPEIFKLALSSIESYDKSKVLMVGDSLTSDMQGGINFGIDTCWYNPKSLSEAKNISPTYQIKTLMDLISIV